MASDVATSPSPEPTPRRAGSADLAGLLALWIALTRHHEALDPGFALRPGAEAEVRRLLEAQLRDPDTAIFLVDGAGGPTAFATVQVCRALPIHPETCRAEITDLYVLPATRRGGLGLTLVAAATAWAAARGAERIEARVVSRNPEGQTFWRAAGFVPHVDVLSRPA